MTRVTVTLDRLVVEVRGWHRLWALKRRVEVPLVHVRAVRHDPLVAREPKGIRAPGLDLPRLATMGTFYRHGQRSFWDIRTGAGAVVIECAGDRYSRLVVEVEEPARTVAEIEAALRRTRPSMP